VISEIILYSIYFISGSIIGSFINVIIYRLPNHIITPRSFCPTCKTTIPLYRNIPILSYIIQCGKCTFCKEKISIRYLSVEMFNGLIWLYAACSFNLYLPDIIYFGIIASILVAIAFIDYDHFIIPIPLIIFSLIYIILFLLYNWFIHDQILSNHFLSMIIGAGYLSVIFIGTWIITKRRGLGYGDLQLLLVLGLCLGSIIKILLIIFVSSLLAVIVWLLISYSKGFDKNRPLPFGTFLSVTSIFIYLIPEKIIMILSTYLSFPLK